MVRTVRWLLLLCLAGCPVLAAPLLAQTTTDPKAAQPKQAEVTAPDPLPGLPQPPDQPANLYAPMFPHPYSDTDPMPPKYFEVNPLLDPPGLLPGWVATVQASLTKPVVINNLVDFVTVGSRAPDLVQLPSSNLAPTVMPRFEVGYRLPAGFGEIAVAYRGLATAGNSTILGPDGIAALRSRLDFNIFDLDYLSREWALGPCWKMDWRIGARLAYVYFDSRASEPATAVTGTGILSQQVTNQHNGFGPHCGLRLSRDLPCAGLSMVGSADISGLFGRIKQGYYETALDTNGQTNFAGDNRSSSQPLAIANGQVGLSWCPPACPKLRVFAGYEFEYWWEVGRLGALSPTPAATGQMWNQGAVVQAQFNW